MFIAFVVRHSSECLDHVLVSRLEGQVFQARRSSCGSGNRFSSYGGKEKRLWDSIKARTVYLQKFCCIYHQIKTGTRPSGETIVARTAIVRLCFVDFSSRDLSCVASISLSICFHIFLYQRRLARFFAPLHPAMLVSLSGLFRQNVYHAYIKLNVDYTFPVAVLTLYVPIFHQIYSLSIIVLHRVFARRQ